MTSALVALAAAVGTPILVAALSGAIGKGKPEALTDSSGTIAPEPMSAVITVACGLLIAAGGLLAMINGASAGHVGEACAIALGLAIALFMSPSLTRMHILKWTEEGVDGPTSLFGPTLGRARTFIRWSDIATCGETSTSYWFLQAHDGRRVYWSYLYRGQLAFRAAIGAHCPALPI